MFQDVSSISPGVDFERAIVDALDKTDATIVVVGSAWASLPGPDGQRRLEESDDYVRREVAAALATGRPVVPVLVDDSNMPEAADLPEELRPLLKRQAIAVRDVAWSEDLDALVGRLRAEIEPGRSRRRRIAFVAAGVAAVVIALVLAIVLWPRNDEPGTGAATLPPCSVVEDRSVSRLPLVDQPGGTYDLSDGSNRRIGYRATAARAQDRQGRWRILADIEVANQSAPVEGATDDWYVTATDFSSVVVDGVEGGPATCFNPLSGARNLEPERRAVFRVGFDISADPRRAELAVVTAGPPIPLTASSA